MPDEGEQRAPAEQRLMSPKAALSVANSVIGAILSTAALVFIAQNMGPTALGILGYAMAMIGFLSFLSDFGVGSVHSNFIRSGEDLGKCVGAYAAIKLVLLAIFSVVTYAMINLWSREDLGGAMPSTDPVIDSLNAFLMYYILLGISQIATHTFDAQGAVAKAHIPSLLEHVVRVSFVIYVATSVYKGLPEGAGLLAASYVAGLVASMLLVAFLMVRVRISKPDRETLMKYIRSLAPVFVVSMIIILDLYLDKVLVGYFWGAEEVGLYFGVQRMAVFVGVFSLAVATLILPSVTTYFTRKDVAASWDVVNQAERYVSLVVIPTAAFYLTFGSQILSVFLTDEFAAEVRTMDLLVIAGTVVALALPLRSAIVGMGSPATLFYVGLGGLGVQLATMIVLVPDSFLGLKTYGLGAFGAATSLLVASIYYFFVLRYMAWRIARIVPTSRSFRHLLCAVLMVGVMYTLDWLLIPAGEWLGLILLALIGTITYGASAYVLGELETSDYRYFRSLLNPQDTLQYAVNELLGKRQ